VNLVFVDTVGMLAVWNRSDQWHADAKRAYSLLDARNTSLYSTTLVLAECANAAARTPFRLEVDEFRVRLEACGTLIWPTSDDWHDAWAAYRNNEAEKAGIVDQLSFLVMRRLGINQAFTNDRHFLAAGFATLF
jgi:predicted nucleic acid-binding protein